MSTVEYREERGNLLEQEHPSEEGFALQALELHRTHEFSDEVTNENSLLFINTDLRDKLEHQVYFRSSVHPQCPRDLRNPDSTNPPRHTAQ